MTKLINNCLMLFLLLVLFRPGYAAAAGASLSSIPLTKLSFGDTKTLFTKNGIEIRAECIGSFQAGTKWCGDATVSTPPDEAELPLDGNAVALMYFFNNGSDGAAAASAGPDIDWGLCSDESSPGFPRGADHETFNNGQQQNLVWAEASPSSEPQDISGGGTSGNSGFVYRSDGSGISVTNAVAGVGLFGANCVFAADVIVHKGHK
jgi:hypothetical protein